MTIGNVKGYQLAKGEHAYDNGYKVADNLNGYTTRKEQQETIKIIQNDVKTDNVVPFLRGYDKYYQYDFHWGFDSGMVRLGMLIGRVVVYGDNFFTQLNTEYGFDEKETLIRDVATKLMKYFEISGATSEKAKIEEILKHENLSSKDIKQLDALAQEAIRYSN